MKTFNLNGESQVEKGIHIFKKNCLNKSRLPSFLNNTCEISRVQLVNNGTGSRVVGRRILNFSRSGVLKWLKTRPLRMPKHLFISPLYQVKLSQNGSVGRSLNTKHRRTYGISTSVEF